MTVLMKAETLDEKKVAAMAATTAEWSAGKGKKLSVFDYYLHQQHTLHHSNPLKHQMVD